MDTYEEEQLYFLAQSTYENFRQEPDLLYYLSSDQLTSLLGDVLEATINSYKNNPNIKAISDV